MTDDTDNRKLFHFNKTSLRDECIERGKKINDLAERLDFCLEVMADEAWLKYDEEYLRE